MYHGFVSAFANITTDFSHHFFIEGGALAVENAIKAAFDYKAQKLNYSEDDDRTNGLDIVHLKEAFHGRSGYTLSLTNTGNMKTKWFPKFNWTRIENPKTLNENFLDCEQKSLSQIEEAVNKRDVAAILLETIQGEGGDNHFRTEYFAAIRELATKNDVILILDEVQTGMGMTGKMWAYEHYGIIPDMICFGKKSQVCGFCATDKINEVKNNVFKQSWRINSTWGGNLMDMLRARHIIEIIQEDKLVDNAHLVGEYFFNMLQGVDEIFNIRHKGLMIAFDFETSQRRDEVIDNLRGHMMALKCGEKAIRLRPHLTFSKQDAETAIEFIKTAIKI